MKKTMIALIIGLTSATTSINLYADDLMTVYQQAMTNDPVVLKATAQFNIAREDINSVRGILLPQIYAYGGYSTGESERAILGVANSSSADTTNYGVRLNMELYHHSSWLNLANSKKAAHRSDIILQAAKQDLITRVSQAYFNLLSARDDLEFATAEKVAIERQLEQTKQRYSVGLTAITDVHEAQAQYDSAVSSEIIAENSIYTAEEALRVITNVYPRDLNILDTNLFSTSRPTPDSANDWQKIAESKSLDLIAQKIAVDIAKENINISRSGHYPTIDMEGSYGSSNTDGENDIYNSQYLNSYSVGVSINVPIYSGGRVSSAVNKSQQSYVSASQDLSLTHRGVVRDTRNAYNTVIAAVAATRAFEQSVLSASKALEATEAGFEVGTRTIVDVLDSTRNLYNAKRNLSKTRYTYIQNVLTLKRSAGTITEQDLADINKGLMVAKK
ncbi:MAG: outer membrane channel protein TolC [Colwellia sp.]|nr:outer membrane channel protein TolC [Colwellia sp.]